MVGESCKVKGGLKKKTNEDILMIIDEKRTLIDIVKKRIIGRY